MLAGEFSAQVRVERKSGAVDANYNTQANTWVLHKMVWARFRPIRAREQTIGNAQEPVVRYEMTVNYLDALDITGDMRFIHDRTEAYSDPNLYSYFLNRGAMGGFTERDTISFDVHLVDKDSAN